MVETQDETTNITWPFKLDVGYIFQQVLPPLIKSYNKAFRECLKNLKEGSNTTF